MQAHDLDAPNLDTVPEPRGRSRLFLEDDPPISVEDGPPTSGEYDASMPSVTKWIPSASAVFLFLFVVVVGTGGAFAWRYYGDQAMDMIRAPALPGTMNKPTAPPRFLSPPLANKPLPPPPPKPAQPPAHVPTPDSSKPVQRAPPQSLLPP